MARIFRCTINGNRTYLNLNFATRIVPRPAFKIVVDQEHSFTYEDTSIRAMRIILKDSLPDEEDPARTTWLMVEHPDEIASLQHLLANRSPSTPLPSFEEISAGGSALNVDQIISVAVQGGQIVILMNDAFPEILLEKPESLPILHWLDQEARRSGQEVA